MNKIKVISLIVVMTVVVMNGSIAGENICPKFAISSVEKAAVKDAATYSAIDTTDLKIHVIFSDQFTEEHVISLKFFTPSGHLYRQIDVPLSPNSVKGESQTRHLPGYPYPVTVAVPEANRSVSETAPSIEIRFPVGGTSIASSSLYGSWSVTGLVDGEELRCFRPMSFEILQ